MAGHFPLLVVRALLAMHRSSVRPLGCLPSDMSHRLDKVYTRKFSPSSGCSYGSTRGRCVQISIVPFQSMSTATKREAGVLTSIMAASGARNAGTEAPVWAHVMGSSATMLLYTSPKLLKKTSKSRGLSSAAGRATSLSCNIRFWSRE